MFFTSAMLLVAVTTCIATVWFMINQFFPFQFNSLFQTKIPTENKLDIPSQKVQAFREWLNNDVISSYREKADQANQWMSKEIQKAQKTTDKNIKSMDKSIKSMDKSIKSMDKSMQKSIDQSINYIKGKAGELREKYIEQLETKDAGKLNNS